MVLKLDFFITNLQNEAVIFFQTIEIPQKKMLQQLGDDYEKWENREKTRGKEVVEKSIGHTI